MSHGNIPTLITGRSHPHPEPIGGASSPVELMPGSRVVLLDQRKLPVHEKYEFYRTPEDVAQAIKEMVVRGAPAIGIAAAYGMAAGAMQRRGDAYEFAEGMRVASEVLKASRPTAVNLMWAVDRMMTVVHQIKDRDFAGRVEAMADAARKLHYEEVEACKRIGQLSLDLVPNGATILTHCNAGALATGGYGTALGVVRAAQKAGKNVRVLACETRPYLQGARLTAWELWKDLIPVEVITDSMAAHFMAKGAIQLCVVGADRIARNGDAANKIGTYSHAISAAAHNVPFYVAAPWSTVDLACTDGSAIPIEERSEAELTHFPVPDGSPVQIVPAGVRVRNPAFDVTPARFITGIITERGVFRPRDGVHLQ
jgi:methylthioribose-1-phosphate isomerase